MVTRKKFLKSVVPNFLNSRPLSKAPRPLRPPPPKPLFPYLSLTKPLIDLERKTVTITVGDLKHKNVFKKRVIKKIFWVSCLITDLHPWKI